MSVAQKLEAILMNTKSDATAEKFQKQYAEMLEKGIIQRKGYNLAEVNVIGDKAPSVQNTYLASVTAGFNK